MVETLACLNPDGFRQDFIVNFDAFRRGAKNATSAAFRSIERAVVIRRSAAKPAVSISGCQFSGEAVGGVWKPSVTCTQGSKPTVRFGSKLHPHLTKPLKYVADSIRQRWVCPWADRVALSVSGDDGGEYLSSALEAIRLFSNLFYSPGTRHPKKMRNRA